MEVSDNEEGYNMEQPLSFSETLERGNINASSRLCIYRGQQTEKITRH